MAKRKPNGYWTLERCKEGASEYLHPKDWKAGSYKSYQAAVRHGWLAECSSHMSPTERNRQFWTFDRCMEDAAKYETRSDWVSASGGASMSARGNGWFDQCTAHMKSAHHGSDNNVIYVWRDAETDLHKIGITSDRIGEGRIGLCGAGNNMDPRIVFMLKVEDARAVEAELLKLGTDPELDSSIDGYTEFRVLTNEELGKAVSTAYQYAVAA